MTESKINTDKTIILVRHGEAQHNVGYREIGEDAYFKKEYIYSSLTSKGKNQALELANKFVKDEIIKDLEIIITSPLDRAIQTASIIYETINSDNLKDITPKNITPKNITPKNITPKNITSKLKFITMEDPREMNFQHPCNMRRTITDINKTYPNVDTSLLSSNDDDLFKNGKDHNRHESLMKYLVESNHKKIMIVSHETYLLELINKYLDKKIDKIDNCGYVII